MKLIYNISVILCLIMLIFSIRDNTRFTKMITCNQPNKKWGWYYYEVDKSINCKQHFEELDNKVQLKPQNEFKMWYKMQKQDWADFKRENGI